ncbi:acyloxyacyl hydrolase [Wolbachia endosymbiont of Dirofilaria (Dirofilaria) immitis]|uniref:Surface protein n=2 Tax=Wolbachia endosymbiont of Dirofilaria immitis TaxID=82301 RepID=Q9K4Y6_9RICK|nr:acyloxyacyl hydrolase [Wolbachia endosymbiont of Dirofilaria (Dirofilaria) immitis]QKX02393.1 P44/Msp2 family outer membrane protein [Wolbachia endosymbiont of Dirofilaria (Dirofilaria) immitis]CAB95873.1 surface protein [Wolbachia endosymbiont of Dirofilaria immitis]
MHYKKFFSATALVALLSLSNAAFSGPIGPIDDEETSYYIRLQYNSEFLPFKTEVDGVIGAKKKSANANVTTDLYKASFMAGGSAFGYKMDDIRVDIEGLYSQLSRDIFETAPTPAIADNLNALSGLVNVYYDVSIEDMPVTPYIGIGVGAAYLSNPLATKVTGDKEYGFGFAYQAKAGISYDVTPEIKLFAGARYFGSYGAKFDKPVTENDQQPIKDGIKVLYGTVGTEAGLMFNF